MVAASPAPSRPGAEYRIGRYRVRARLGKGGMGVVYLGRDEALDRDVAVKTLRVDGSPDDESRGRFEIEAKAAARLQHPNIVTVFELGEDRGLPFIAMELLGGQDLETLIRSHERLSATERMDIVIQTLRGLDFAHNHHIVHRDMKPSNIRVLDDGGVKILDFGIAKVESTSVTRAGMMVGTPYYMSPEHIRGGALDGRSDVFAMGVILHELFAGKRPFSADDPTRVLYRIVNEPHPRLNVDAVGPLTEEVQRVIDKALEKNVDERFPSAGAMADALTRVRDRHRPPALPPEDAAALNQARAQLATSELSPPAAREVERIAAAYPDATEAQRLLRLVKRRPAEGRRAEETLSFPELDATFEKAQARGEQTVSGGATMSGRAETIQQGAGPQGAGPQAATPAPPSNVLLYGAVAVCLLTGGLAAYLYFHRPGPPAPTTRPAPIPEIFVPGPSAPAATPGPASATTSSGKPAPARTAPAPDPRPAAAAIPKATIEIRSDPPGASVLLDRKAVGLTPLRAELAANVGHELRLSLSGYQSKDIPLSVPLPPSVDASLSPDGPPARLTIESSYPVSVSVSGRVVSSAKAGVSTSLPAGNYELVVESPTIFLRHRESVRLEPGGSFAYRAPGTGKVGVRASPDNCKIFVDGAFVDYPPIIDRSIAAGDHVISFEWPDGARASERVVIREGRPSYVMGRKP